MRNVKRWGARGCAAMLGAAVALAVVPAGVGHASGDQRARKLLERGARAAYEADFTGEVVVEWRDGNGRREQRTEVASADGVLHVGDQVVGSQQRMVRRTAHGWDLLATSVAGAIPDPAAKYDLDVRRGPVVAHRPTTEVRIRAHGQVRERLAFDTTTGVLLRRDQLDHDGRLDRRVAFLTFTDTHGVTRPLPPRRGLPRSESTAGTPRVTTGVPDGWLRPHQVADGYRLVTTLDAASDGGVQLFYSDGVVGLSVFESGGTTDWGGLPPGGTSASVGGARARAYTSAAGHALVYEDDGVTYTFVSDAPLDDITAFATQFGGEASPGWLERVSRFVTGPFSWG